MFPLVAATFTLSAPLVCRILYQPHPSEMLMDFTERELKLVARLRKQEQLWPRDRWGQIGAGIFSMAVAGFILNDMRTEMLPHIYTTNPDNFMVHSWMMGFAIFWPICLFNILVGTGLIVMAIINWNGNVNRMLLLKLLDAQQQNSTDGEK